MADPSTDRPMASGEVAALFGVDVTSVGRWADEGLIPCFRTPGGQRRFRREDVERFLETQGRVA